MPQVLIIHEVADFDAWKQVFDQAAGIRREAGERSYQVLRDAGQPNRIVHFSVWTSHAAARTFFESPRLVQIRAAAGVRAPEFVYLDEVEHGTL
jgi:quinol monooxygenase YgiN